MGVAKERLRELAARDSLSCYLPYVAWEEGMYVLADASLGFMWEINPLLFAGEDAKRILGGVLGDRVLPPGSSVKFHVFASEFISPFFPEEGSAENRVCREIAAERKRLYTQDMRERVGVPARDFRFLVSVRIPPDFGKSKVTESVWDKHTESARKLGANVTGVLNSAQLYPRDFPPEELILLLRETLNPDARWYDDPYYLGRPGGLYDRSEEIRNQIIDRETMVEVREGEITLGDARLRGYSPASMPEYFSLNEFHELLGDPLRGLSQIPAYFFLQAGFVIPERKKTSEVRAKAVMVKQQSFGLITRFIPRLRKKAENFDFLVNALEDEGLVMGSLSLFLKTRSEEEAERVKEMVTGIWRARNFDLREEKYILLPLFLESLPLGAEPALTRLLRRNSTMQTSAGASILPVMSDWKGTGSGPLTFISRRGQIMKLDLFDSASNYNCAVFAQSGSGKSFLTSDMITGYLSEGAQVFVIDIGRSYEKLCGLMGGEFVVFDEKSGISLNPFSRVTDINEDMELLKPLFAQMASPSEKIGDLGKSLLEEAIKKAWEKSGPETRIDDVVEALSGISDPHQRSDDLAHMLYAYSSRGQYGRFFEGPSNLSFENDLNVLELEELKAKPELQTVVVLMIIWHIEREMYLGSRERRKLAIIDEAWDLLGGGFSGEFIAHGYRRARKYNGAFVSVTQSLLDFYRAGDLGESVLENSAWMFMLRQKGESVEEIKKGGKLLLGDYFGELVSTLSTRPGEFSEVFIYNSECGMGLGRLVVDPFSYWTYTTNPDDVSLLNGFISQGMEVHEAIERCVETSRGKR